MGDGLAAITQGKVLAGRALKISNRVSIRALKLSDFERFRTIKISIGFYDFRALKLSNRVSSRALKLSKRKTESVFNDFTY